MINLEEIEKLQNSLLHQRVILPLLRKPLSINTNLPVLQQQDRLPVILSRNPQVSPTTHIAQSASQPPRQQIIRRRSSTLGSIDTFNIHSIDRIRLDNASPSTDEELDTNEDHEKVLGEPSTLARSNSANIPEQNPGSIHVPLHRLRSNTTSATLENHSFLKTNYPRRNTASGSPTGSPNAFPPIETAINPESPTWLLSDLLGNLSSVKDKDEYFIVAKGNDLVLLFQQNPGLKYNINLKNFINKIQFMFYYHVSEVRSMGYRIVRHIISNYETLTVLIQSKILIFIIITMSTTRSSLGEKEQALKLIREFLVIDKGADNLSIGVIKSLICLIEESESSSIEESNDSFIPATFHSQQTPQGFKNICIETICEIALLKPELIFHSGGFKVLINTIMNDSSAEVSANCILIFIKILDFKNSRKFLRNGYDLMSIISVFSSMEEELPDLKVSSKKSTNLKLQKVSFLITILLKNFNGLMALSINKFKVVEDLISNLKKPHVKLRDNIMDILFDVLIIKPLPWLSSSSIGTSMETLGKLMNSKKYSFHYTPELQLGDFERKLTNHYKGLLTLIFIKHHILEYLLIIVEQNLNESNTKKATLLITHIYSIANNLLPPELTRDLLLLPTLSSYSLLEIDKSVRLLNSTPKTDKYIVLKKYLKNISTKARYNVDDAEFKLLINSTKILTVKEFEEWNWNLLLNLIQGPLTNPKRFDEVVEKNPKFFKRIMSFYRPFKFRFCNISKSAKNSWKYVTIGCQLLELFLKFDSGIRYLLNNKILPQLTEIVAQINPYSGISAKEPILSLKRLENTVSYGYLKFLGVLSTHPSGLKILEHWQFFSLFQDIIEGSTDSEKNNALIMELLKNVDYTIDSQFRIILAKAMKISNIKIRLYINNHLLTNLIKIQECEYFVIKLLVNNLYESRMEIVHKSIDLLNEYYSSNNFKHLNLLIDLNPAIHILSRYKSGVNLLLNFLTIPKGFKYLEDFGFIEKEFNKWVNISEFSYLQQMETVIQNNFFPYLVSPMIENDFSSINFFKYLLSTEEGLQYFSNYKQKSYLDKLINDVYIVSQQFDNDDGFKDIENQEPRHVQMLNSLKENLWILGSIALGTYGIQLLDPSYNITLNKSIISIILDLFHTCPVWQIRGLCFFLIGLISTTIEGVEILDESNWISLFDQYSNSMSIAYPKKDIFEIFNVKISNPYRDAKYYAIFNGNLTSTGTKGSTSMWDIMDSSDAESPEDDLQPPNLATEKVNDQVIYLIHQLNSVLGKIERKAIKELIKLKKNTPEVFDNLILFLEIIKTIDKGNFRFHKRRFIFDMFLDTKVLESLSRRDRKIH